MIEIHAFEWDADRGDWRVDYTDSRDGVQTGRRFIPLPETATVEDFISFIRGE